MKKASAGKEKFGKDREKEKDKEKIVEKDVKK